VSERAGRRRAGGGLRPDRGRHAPQRARAGELSKLVDQPNERLGMDFRPADQPFFDQVKADVVDRDDIR
jgi:hypothetical protein